jgi:Tfp pilus assembly protein PilF
MKTFLITLLGMLFLSGCVNTPKQAETSLEADYQVAESHYQAGQMKLATPAFNAILKSDPTHIMAHFRLGNIALRGQHYDEAEQHYKAILELDRRHAKSHYNLGVIYLLQAERYFQYFTATAPQEQNDPRLLKLLDAINRFSGEQEQSHSALDELTELLSEPD